MEQEEDINYPEDSQFFEEGEEIYDDYGDGAEYIEVDGRLVLHNPSRERRQQQQEQHQQLQQQSIPQPQLQSIKEESSQDPAKLSPSPSSSTTSLGGVTKTSWGSDPPPQYFGKAPYKIQNPNLFPYKKELISSPAILGHGEVASQRKAFYEMKEQVIQHRQKNKKKIVAPGQRKPCNCNKSQCLKLYCDCFANGEFCRDCNCKDCHNNISFDSARTKAIRQSLERNPNAFKPKIGLGKGGAATDIERLHQKGCQCKKSGCLKNYCECYEAKVPCTDRCKCRGCQNTEHYRMHRYKGAGSSAILSLANSSDSRPSSVAGEEVQDEYDDMNYSTQKPPVEQDPTKFPWFYMTDEVVEATTLCMVAQAEEALNTTQPEVLKLSEEERVNQMERLILREFGRCLEQIIQNSLDSPENP